MNIAANTAGMLIVTRPHVLTLHAPDGSTRCSFASERPMELAEILRGWEQYCLCQGYTAIEWQQGEPVMNFVRA